MSIGAAKITAAGKLVQLNPKAEPDAVVTEADVQSPHLLAKLLTGILAELARLRRRYAPRHIDFEDRVAPGPISLRHGFSGRVRWWVVDWTSTGTNLVDSGGSTLLATWCDLTKQATTDANTLVLQGHIAGTVTVRVQEAD